MGKRTRWLVALTVVLWFAVPVRGGGIVLQTPPGLSPGESFRFMFITPGTTQAISSNIAQYNSFVNAQAGGATYNGTVVNWLAIGSTSSVSAINNVGQTQTPVYLADGTLVTTSTTSTGLWSGSLFNPIDETLSGTERHGALQGAPLPHLASREIRLLHRRQPGWSRGKQCPGYLDRERSRNHRTLVERRSRRYAGRAWRHKNQGKLQEAIAEYRAALRISPEYLPAHMNLGNILGCEGKLDEAIVEFREAFRERPGFILTHNNLGCVLDYQGKVEDAMAEWREAIRLEPRYPHAHFNLGLAHRFHGEFTEAIAELRKARDLARSDRGLAREIERELVTTEDQAPLAPRLPAVLAGKHTPGNADETLGFARLCYGKRLYGISARLWAEAFQSQPRLAEDTKAQNRFVAACAAALAGCGQGKDDLPLDEPAKARSRKQAIEWLKADLVVWSKASEGSSAQAREIIVETLHRWLNYELAGLREPSALAKLPEDEQKACRALWAEVIALLAKARGDTAP